MPEDADSIGVRASRVDERFFETLGIRITRGRAFTSRDNASAPGVVIVNETMARRYQCVPQEKGYSVSVQWTNSIGAG